jgi:hypothetical membrane protein
MAVIAMIVLATRLTPKYSSVSDTLSQLAVAGSPHPEIIDAALLVSGSMLIGFAWVLHRRVVDRRRANRIGSLIAVAGIAVVGAAIVHDDPNAPHGSATIAGAIHGSLASLAFLSLIFGLFTFSRASRAERGQRWLADLSVRIGVTCAVVGAVFEIQVVQQVEGLLQRIFITLFVAWMEIVIFRYVLPSGPDSRSRDRSPRRARTALRRSRHPLSMAGGSRIEDDLGRR